MKWIRSLIRWRDLEHAARLESENIGLRAENLRLRSQVAACTSILQVLREAIANADKLHERFVADGGAP